jgi:hypothetical protein
VADTPGSGHKLGILRSEAQHSGERQVVTGDLIALLRCLMAVMSRSKQQSSGDDFWAECHAQLIRMTFGVFLLSSEPLKIDSLTHFINLGPLDLKSRGRTSRIFPTCLPAMAAGKISRFTPKSTGIGQPFFQK